MGSQSAGIDFALIGHVDRWDKLFKILRELRDTHRGDVAESELRSIVPWIPPRTAMRLNVHSHPSGKVARGIYIETFITPDQLEAGNFKQVVEKVRYAAEHANRAGARIAALGGFTSIAVESRKVSLPSSPTVFTTGNTLTAAYIVKGVEAAVQHTGRQLNRSNVLIIGSTGDVGSGCARYLSRISKRLLLNARNPQRLDDQASELQSGCALVESSTNLDTFLSAADVVVCTASFPRPSLSLSLCKPDALICDAGYPHNFIDAARIHPDQRLFLGGLGCVRGQLEFQPDLRTVFNEFPLPNIVNGCMLEGALLALEGRYEPFSQGRGQIVPERIEEIWMMAQRHGFTLSPFFDGNGLWERCRAYQ